MLKKVLSLVLSLILVTSCITITGNAINTDIYFQYTKIGSVYEASFKSEVDLTGVSDLVIPEDFNDGLNGILPVALNTLGTNNAGNTIRTVKTASPTLSVAVSAFSGLNSLEKVEYTCKDILTIKHRTFESCSTTLKDIYIYASSVVFDGRFAPRAFTTFKDIPDAKIHVVKDSGVKQQIVDGTKGGSAPVPESMIVEDLTDERKTSSIEINCADINYGTKGGFKPSVTVKLDNVENAELKDKVKLEIHGNAECTDSPSYKYNSDDLAVGHYWIKASLDGTDEYKGSTAVKEVQVKDPNEALKTGLKAVIDQADEVKTHQGDYHRNAASVFTDKVIDTDGDETADMSLYDYAKKVYADPAAKITDITDAITKLDEGIKALVLTADLASPEERNAFIAEMNTYINTNKADYTEDSWTSSGFEELQKELAEKYTTSFVLTGAVSSEQLNSFKEQIKAAYDKLVPITDFSAYVPALQEAVDKAKAILDDGPEYKYTASQIEALQAAYDAAKAILDDLESVTDRGTITNAASNLNTFIDRLEEVDKEKMLSDLQKLIESAEALDSESYTADSYQALTDAIEAAKSVTVDSKVSDLEEASDNLTSAVNGLKKDTDAIQAAKDELSKAVEEAEAIDSSKYTEDSYAKLSETINEAKGLIAKQNSNLTVRDLKAAKAAIEEAISGLKEKPTSPSEKPSVNNNNNNVGTNVNKPPVNNNVIVKTTSKADAVKAAKAKAKSQMRQAKIKKLKVKSKAKKTITVSWKKVKKAKGYRVQVSTNKKFKKSKIIFDKHTKKKTLKITKKIKSGKKYYVRVSAYTTYKDINGKAQKVYSKWNKKLRKVKVK